MILTDNLLLGSQVPERICEHEEKDLVGRRRKKNS